MYEGLTSLANKLRKPLVYQRLGDGQSLNNSAPFWMAFRVSNILPVQSMGLWENKVFIHVVSKELRQGFKQVNTAASVNKLNVYFSLIWLGNQGAKLKAISTC